MIIVCWQTILMKIHTFLYRKFRKMSQNLIGALRVKKFSNKLDDAYSASMKCTLQYENIHVVSYHKSTKAHKAQV